MSEPGDFEDEAAEGEYYQRLYEEIGPEWAVNHDLVESKEAVGAFKNERLCSYFLKYPDVAERATESIRDARSILGTQPDHALILGVTAIELILRDVFLKPIVFGSVLDEPIAEFVANTTVKKALRRNL